MANSTTEMVNVPEEVPEDDNVQVVLVAPRPQSKRSLKRKNSMKVHNGNAVKILSIDSFKNGGLRRQQSMDVCENSRIPSIQRLLSIPDVLLNATMAHNAGAAAAAAHATSHSASGSNNGCYGSRQVPRTRAVNMFVQREQVRPVYAPMHPCDLEGLQETAV